MQVRDLVVIKNSDMTIPRNTYLTPIKTVNGFIKDELIFVKRFESDNTVIFRPMDGKEYSITKEKLKYFKLTGR